MFDLLASVTTALAFAIPGNSCATVDNSTNTAVRVSGTGHSTTYHYRDTSSRLVWFHNGNKVRPPLVVRMAAATLRVGKSGHHVRSACNITAGVL